MKTIEVVHTIASGSAPSASPASMPPISPIASNEQPAATERVAVIEAQFTIVIDGAKQ